MTQPNRGRWTVRPNDLVNTTQDDGHLTLSIPFYLNGVLQFTQETRVTADGELRVEFKKAPGCVVRGFRAWSDF